MSQHTISSITERGSPSGRRRRFGRMIGSTPLMQDVYDQIDLAANTNIPVLLLGETGTGKDLAAQAIHRRSPWSKHPYVPANLSAYPSSLVASELFGHERGSFSGAHQRFAGIFERACNGTVFLDEIDCIEEKVRVSLLRVLDSMEFHRIGGNQPLRAEFRLISASNADLPSMAETNEFRMDLFFRLDGLRISMPPLRKRIDDIPQLVNYMVAGCNRSLNKKVKKIAPAVIDLLCAYNWPGNVRELKSVIQNAMLFCKDKTLRPEHLPDRIAGSESPRRTVTFAIGTSLDQVERQMIVKTLEATHNNRRKTASLLGISRRAIYSKLHKHNLM